MIFKQVLGDAFDIVEKVAPAIATAIGSPAAGAATTLGINLLGTAFGVHPANISDLAAAIKSNPDTTNILAHLDSCFGKWLSKNSDLMMPKKLSINVQVEWPDDDEQPDNAA